MKPLTRDHSETIKADLNSNPDFRGAYLREAVSCLVAGEIEVGKVMLREYIEGTLGFGAIGDALGKSPKAIIKILSDQTDPQVRDIFSIVACLQKEEGIVFEIRAVKSGRPTRKAA